MKIITESHKQVKEEHVVKRKKSLSSIAFLLAAVLTFSSAPAAALAAETADAQVLSETVTEDEDYLEESAAEESGTEEAVSEAINLKQQEKEIIDNKIATLEKAAEKLLKILGHSGDINND